MRLKHDFSYQISPQLALKITPRRAILDSTLKEQFHHVWRFRMYLMGAQGFHFRSITTDNHSDMLHCDCATAMILAM